MPEKMTEIGKPILFTDLVLSPWERRDGKKGEAKISSSSDKDGLIVLFH